MPKPIAVLMNWIHMPPTEMASLAHKVASKLPASADPAPPVSAEALNTEVQRLQLAYANRLNGPEAKTEFENADEAVDNSLHALAAWVNTVANGDKAIIEGFGFTATSDSRKKAVVPNKPDAPSISGNAAALHLQVPAVYGAATYCWVISTNGTTAPAVADTHIVLPGAAIVLPDGTAREILRAVVNAGATITVQVLAQNAAGKSGFSPQISFTVGS